MTTNPEGRFAGKVAFVTRAGGGIGRATAIAFAREGASVVAAHLTEEHVRGTVSSIETGSPSAPHSTTPRRHPHQRHLPRGRRHADDRTARRQHRRRIQRLHRARTDRRLGTTDEIADAVLWLSDGAAFTIGHTLVVDGGQRV